MPGWNHRIGWAALGWVLLGPQACLAAETVTAPEGRPALAVELHLQVRGELFATAGETEAVRRPITLDARFAFVEEAVTASAGDAASRRYTTARAEVETEGRLVRQQLAADARNVKVRLEGTTPRPYLAAGFLSRDEAELLDVPFDTLLIDGVRPEQPAAKGGTWKLPGDLAAGLLAIDTVESGSIEATLLDVDQGRATIGLEGTVAGAADGVPTSVRLTGRAVAAASPDTDQTWRIPGPITSLEATITERREAGWIAPGLDVEATIVLNREPLTAATEAPTETPAVPDGLAPPAVDRPAGEGRPGVVWHRHRQGRYAAVLDSRWREVEDGPEGLVLRLSDRGRLVAQCSILPLPRVAADAPPEEQTVRDDVRRSLGDQFGLLAESEASTRDDGTRLVRVVAEGAADGRAFRWIHYVLTDPAGHRVAVTFMHEPALIGRFAAADRELVAGLVILPDAPRQALSPKSLPAQEAPRR